VHRPTERTVRLNIRASTWTWRWDGIDARDLDAYAGNAAIFLFIGGLVVFGAADCSPAKGKQKPSFCRANLPDPASTAVLPNQQTSP
jgi:hypothetical protein